MHDMNAKKQVLEQLIQAMDQLELGKMKGPAKVEVEMSSEEAPSSPEDLESEPQPEMPEGEDSAMLEKLKELYSKIC